MSADRFVDRLSPHALRVLSLTAHLPAPDRIPFDVESVEAVAARYTPVVLKEFINELAAEQVFDLSGIDPVRGHLYTIPTDVLAHARTLAPDTAPQVAALHLDHTAASAHAASVLLTPHRAGLARTARHGDAAVFDPEGSKERAMDWLASTLPTLDAALDLAEQHGEHQVAANLVYAMFPVLHRTRPREEGAAVFSRGLAFAEAWGDQSAVRSMLSTLATFLRAVPGGTGEAVQYLQRAADLAAQAGDDRAVLHHRRSIAACHHTAGDYAKALPILIELLPQFDSDRADDCRQHMLAEILTASALTGLGRPEPAIRHLTTALQQHAQLLQDDPLNQARALAFLAEAYSHTGNHTAALLELGRAQLLFADLRVPLWHAHTLELQADIAERAGHRDTSQHYLARAHTAYRNCRALTDAERTAARLSALARSTP